MLVLLVLLGASAETLYQEGIANFGKGEPREAANLFAKAVDLDPNHARAWKALGVAYSVMTQYDLAAHPLERACTLDPSLEDACYYWSRNLYARNRFEDSLRVLEKVVIPPTAPARIANARGQALEALGRNREAEAAYRISIRQLTSVPSRSEEDARLSFGIFLMRQGKPSEAIDWLRKAAAAYPRFAKPHFELGRAQYQLQQLDAARESLETALAADPNFEAARLLLAKITNRLRAH